MSGETYDVYNIPAHLKVKGEIRDLKLQKLNDAPSDAVEAQLWWDSANHRPMCNNGTTNKELGKEYYVFTGADGTNAGTSGLVPAPAATDNTKVLLGSGSWGTLSTGFTNTSGTITVTNYDRILLNQKHDYAHTVVIGANDTQSGRIQTGELNVVIGYSASAAGDGGVAIGSYAMATSANWNSQAGTYIPTSSGGTAVGFYADARGNKATAIGSYSKGQTDYSIGIGYHAEATKKDAIQIGYGVNNAATTLSIGFYNNSTTHYNWTLLDGTTGYIPNARLNMDSTPTSSSGNAITSGAVYTALGNYLATSLKGAVNGVAELDSSGKVPSSQLPSFVDDAIELLTLASSAPSTCAAGDMYFNTTSSKIFTATATDTWGTTGADPEKGKIYVALDTNYSYRWGGSTMINIANPVAAATESTAGIAEIATQSEVNTGTDDTRFVTPKKLAAYVSPIKTFAVSNTALTESSGKVTWTITNSLGTADVASVRVYNISTGETIFAPWGANASTITIEMLADDDVSANTYRAVVMG